MTEETNTPEWASLVYHRSQEEEKIPPETRKRVLRRDNRRCVRCRARKRLEVHHIMPRCEGGGLNLHNLVTLCSDCHNEIEPLDLRSRALIENWVVKEDTIQHKEAAPDSEEWHAWVYGGYARPQQELEQTSDKQFISVSEKVWLRRMEVELTTGADLIAPQSVHWEIDNAFSAMLRRGRIKVEQAIQAVKLYQ